MEFVPGLPFGNTSTCVEKTIWQTMVTTSLEKHLHMRGENSPVAANKLPDGETPPHAWRKPDVSHTKIGSPWKHLHMRGENIHEVLSEGGSRETPPHAWRKLWHIALLISRIRNTSTCVEKTGERRSLRRSARKHLHMRGENPGKPPLLLGTAETPPHAWRKLTCSTRCCFTWRNTSTCVEKTC